MIKKVELLAPAGSKEAFYAAINSGADAVYLGGKSFNARHYSENFSNEDLAEIVGYAHNKGAKVYVTVNIILKDAEIIEVMDYIFYLYEIDVDAVIVQDLGLVYLINKYLPDFNVNISTQASIYDKYGVEFFKFADNIGKFILARELSLEQIKEIADSVDKANQDNKTNSSVETFIHGALCMCYSGQCYFSSFLGGRSGNRGKCAQPCRLNYSFLNKRKNSIEEKFEEKPLLSLKDFKAGDSVCDLIDVGVETLKIEGRMKNPEYTAIVTEYYRKVIDNCLEKTISKHDIRLLEKKVESVFSRGFTNGYLSKNAEDMLAGVSSGSKGADIEDIIDEIKDKISPNSNYRRKSIDLSVEIKLGSKIKLIANDGKHEVITFGDEIVEKSIKNPVTREIIEDQISKLGNTVFSLNNLEINFDENAFVGKSTLNKLRREAIDKIYQLNANYYDRKNKPRISKEDMFRLLENPKQSKSADKFDAKPKISLKINSEEELESIDFSKIGRVYFPVNLASIFEASSENAYNKGKMENVEKYLYIPNIVSEEMYEYLKDNMKIYEDIFDGVCVNNIGTYSFFEKHSKLKIHCGYFFNIINSYNAKALQEKGAEGISFSIESNIKDIEAISENTVIKTELVSYAYIQMMTMKNCPFSVLKKCKSQGNCSSCEYRIGYQLKDRLGVNFNIERENKVSLLYNSVPMTTIGKTSEFLDYNINYYFVDSKWVEDINAVIDVLHKEINEQYVDTDEYDILKSNSFTRGHYFKNVL